MTLPSSWPGLPWPSVSLGAQPLQQVRQFALFLVAQARRRLVQQQDAGIRGQGARDLQDALLSQGQRAGLVVQMLAQAHALDLARTTVDLTLQKQADEALVTFLKQRGRGLRINSGALVALETDGAVRAIVGGPDYGESQFNRARHARRQPGSSFKIYVYAAALENGYSPTSVVRDSSRNVSDMTGPVGPGGRGCAGIMCWRRHSTCCGDS